MFLAILNSVAKFKTVNMQKFSLVLWVLIEIFFWRARFNNWSSSSCTHLSVFINRPSQENHTRSQTAVDNKLEKSLTTNSRPKRRKHHTLWDTHTYRDSKGEQRPLSPRFHSGEFFTAAVLLWPTSLVGGLGYFFGGGASLAVTWS